MKSCRGRATPITPPLEPGGGQLPGNLPPRNLVRDFKKLLRRAGLPDMRFHDLRHSCASLLAVQGIPARVAMDVLGHADIRTTQNIYTHVFDEAKRQAADVMDRLFGDVDTDTRSIV